MNVFANFFNTFFAVPWDDVDLVLIAAYVCSYSYFEHYLFCYIVVDQYNTQHFLRRHFNSTVIRHDTLIAIAITTITWHSDDSITRQDVKSGTSGEVGGALDATRLQ